MTLSAQSETLLSGGNPLLGASLQIGRISYAPSPPGGGINEGCVAHLALVCTNTLFTPATLLSNCLYSSGKSSISTL